MTTGEGRYLRTNGLSNAVDSLLMAARCSADTQNLYRWKWVAIALHSALYGFCICAIEGTDYDRVMTKKGRLISAGEALRRCQLTEWMNQFIFSKPLPALNESQKHSVRKLSQVLRNTFEHFWPSLWSVELSGMPVIVSDICDIIEFLLFKSGNLRLEPAQQQQDVERALKTLRSALP